MTVETADTAPVVLSARRICKSFSGVQVLFSVNFDLRAGEIHALMGENGAGKSTLVKVLSGFEQPSSGEILLDGKPVVLPPNGAAEALGIVIIHQEFNLAEHLTVTESLFLGREVTRFGVLDRKYMRSEARKVLDVLGSHVDENALISTLSIADKQMVEIAKAISRDARVVFMDEPTAVLSSEETNMLFKQVRKLRDQGTSFVFVSHKLDEVMELTDRVTVLRDGQWIKTSPTSVLDGESIAQLMVGRELSSLYPAKVEPDVDEEIVLRVASLSTGYVKDASFEVRKGEIIGFSGMIGSGRTELMEAIAGLRTRLEGEVVIKGETVPSGDVHAANRCGLAYMTKDRKSKGLLLRSGMVTNLTLQSLGRHARHGYLSPGSEAAAMAKAKRRFDIRVRDGNIVAGRMSGGNQQKLLLAKVMETEPQIIIIDEPTRGIDVGTKQQIYHFISALARDGRSIIVVSSEMPEVIGLCTRVAVMREGRIVGVLEGEEISEQEIMRYAAGLKKKAA
ncbi:sugar ABC transporter ATP-binding protein [Rhizobium leguminosarum bv. viciae 248]|uniref:sugar ABC transporter ATP-binding protein n=1 Tax=Rhizobium leguminosarum TaxID=384 RepID=UPI000381FEDE|nr:sugar ABC transporter ATP-binding protein [Rhizobium leguminosarum]MBY5838711.1 sugar ABC transporter ATP-binding protein [Rhizobium leguminosarum]MBY5867579.1 sugar ABC transporter ATP-binding protein [Rhizobium leguminosarum]MCA2410100.1 sugar ABC transporter ATP-binding protein [Rhizobium leguminosarum]NKM04926.1 ATP-binding cassette domain-containing protein [Rhizobium leguminosarum bv. viciae]NKM61191.1 ATP-binding cassette domain-containing protein [Rhizobium leguminosarum bv. viciae]